MFAHYYSKLPRTCYGESTPYALHKCSVLRWPQKHDDDDDENRERPLVESSKLWDRRQQSCAIHNVKAERAGSSSRHVKKNAERNEQLSPTLEHTDQTGMTVQHDEDTS